MAKPLYYPPSPPVVPADLTKASHAYRVQGTLVLVALIAFAGLYFLAILGSLVLPVLAFLYTPIWFAAPFALFAAAGFFFLIKGFFAKHHAPRTFNVEIDLDDHPRLKEFVELLCEETGAPMPYRVFLSPEVNAAVFYDGDSVLDLLIPPRKNLLIGLGLVNVLNLSEFKAVLAHEFGHFSQKAMLLHRYIYSANRIMIDLVYGRDWFDDMVAWMCEHPDAGALAPLGWVIAVPMWCFRKVLEGYLLLLNLLGAGLSRQMEFNADLVAVRVSGSDAIINGLSRLDFAGESLVQALEELKAASDHELYTCDLFHHMNHAAAYLRKVRKKPTLGEPPPVPKEEDCSAEVFDPEDEPPEMYATHPSNYDREQNAKRVYLRCPIDERSPWLLFDDVEGLREMATWKFYRVVWGVTRDVELSEARDVQRFIDEEHAETTYHPRYHGAYDNRPIRPGNLDQLAAKVRREPWSPEVLGNVGRRLYLTELEERMKDLKALREDRDFLEKIDDDNEPLDYDGTFRFRGKRYDERDIERLRKKVDREMDEQYEWLHEFDGRVFRVHYQMAREVSRETAEDLLERYRFHMEAQELFLEVGMQRPALEAALAMLSDSGKMDYDAFHFVRTILIKAHDAMERAVVRADRLEVPALKNMKPGEPLGRFLVPGKVVKGLRPTASRFTAAWLAKFLGQLGAMEDRLRRIHFKSLGGILALQEQVLRTWLRDGPKVAPQPEEAEEDDGTYQVQG